LTDLAPEHVAAGKMFGADPNSATQVNIQWSDTGFMSQSSGERWRGLTQISQQSIQF
jgi:hypothetical protein